MLKLILSISFLIFLNGNVSAASFDCTKASTVVEKAICSDPEISGLDTTMAAMYKEVRDKSENPKNIVANQRDWLRLVRGVCKTRECLYDAYQDRIRALKDGNLGNTSLNSITANILPQPNSPATGSNVTIAYGKATSKVVADWLAQQKFLENVKAEAERLAKLPAGLRLIAQQCGTANAFYSEQANTAVLCYEFAELIMKRHWERVQNQQQAVDEAVRYLAGLKFIMFHEIGHAIFYADFKKGSLAREETEADSFASAALIGSITSPDQADPLIWGVWSMLAPGQKGAEDLSDEHELSGQRWANFACLVGGRFPTLLPRFVQSNNLSQQRSNRCQNEWKRTWNGFQTLTAKTKLPPH